MQLLYPHEHLSCYNYSNGEKPEVEKVSIDKGKMWSVKQIDNKIIFVLRGELSFSSGRFVNKIITARKGMLIPLGHTLISTANEDTEIIVFRLRSQIQLCDTFSLEKLMQTEYTLLGDELHYLDIDERLGGFIDCLNAYITDGLRCFYFFQIKTRELFYLLRAYYSKEELRCFFDPIISNDVGFSNQVYRNYKQTRTAQELASIMNYSLSGFQKRFKKVFGISAYHWLTEQRARSIMHEINCNEKSFKEISDEYGFSSPSHFNDFCKLHLGDTPGRIRENAKLSKKRIDGSK